MEFEDFRGFWLFGMAPPRILPLDFDMAPESRWFATPSNTGSPA